MPNMVEEALRQKEINVQEIILKISHVKLKLEN